MPTDPDQIDYAPRRQWLRSRRIRAWITIIVVLLAMLPVALKFARLNADRMRANRLMETCLRYTPPPTVFCNDPAKPSATVAAPWTELASLRGITINSSATLFLHERRPPHGSAALVAVDLVAVSPQDPLTITLSSRTLSAGGSSSGKDIESAVTTIELAPQRAPLTIAAGQADGVDVSHFTITCTVADHATTLDGWLHDDGSVAIEPRVTSSY